MGSWLGTCGLTQLPIKKGDKIVLFPMMRMKSWEEETAGFVYHHDRYSPISLPLHGEYDECGGIKHVSKNGDAVFWHLSKILNDRISKVEIDVKEMERQGLDGTPANIEQLINNYIERGVYKGVGFMMVLEDVYNDVMSKARKEKTRSGAALGDYLYKSFSDLISYFDYPSFNKEAASKRIEELRSKLMREPIGDDFFDKDRSEREITDDEMLELQKLETLNHGYFQMDGLANGFDFLRTFAYLKGHYRRFADLILAVIKKVSSPLQQELVDFSLFDMVLSRSRKAWMPQMGKGNKSGETEYHSVIAESVLRIINNRRRQEIENGA